MLMFTNRLVAKEITNESAFSKSFTPGSAQLAMAYVEPDRPGAQPAWKVTYADDDVSDAEGVSTLATLFEGTKPVLVYLHGNNNTPGACFTRCDLLRTLYDVEVVGFSWASEGYLSDGTNLPSVPGDQAGGEQELEQVKALNRTQPAMQGRIQRYLQAKVNAQASVDALARFFRLTATARMFANKQPFTLAAHSLGAFFVQYTLPIGAAREALGTAQNIAFLAPCTRAIGHISWLSTLSPKGMVFVTYNRGDSVLFGASIADNHEPKLGTEPGIRLRSPSVRYVSFNNTQVGFGGHRYFIKDDRAALPDEIHALFEHVFGSEPDLLADAPPEDVYIAGCDADLVTCYMGPLDNPIG